MGTYDWFYFCSQPKISKNPTRRNKKNYNRFYINFHSFDDAVPFIDKFRKLTFEKTQNAENKKPDFYQQNAQNETFKLCIEFAPNQQLPKDAASADRRLDTISTDKDYLRYVEELKRIEKDSQETIKSAQESLIRTSVTLINKYPSKKSSKSDKKKVVSTEEAKSEQIIAPLAKHVAAQRNRRQFYKKNLNRASLVKSEKIYKEKSNKEIREKRQKKRIELAKKKRTTKSYFANKVNPKLKRREYDEYGGYQEYDDNVDYNVQQRGRGRSRFRGKGRLKKAYRGRGGRRKSYNEQQGDNDHYRSFNDRKGHQTWRSKAK